MRGFRKGDEFDKSETGYCCDMFSNKKNQQPLEK